jgi:hypothetical protein
MARKDSPKVEQIDLKRLRLRSGDVLVVREPESAPEDYREKVLERLGNVMKGKHVLVIFVDRLSDVKALSPEQLANIGLQRIPNDS